MRHKVYTREQILRAAFNLAVDSGFDHFTARNIAKKMGGSTQPIYFHFESMKDLKVALIKWIQEDMIQKMNEIPESEDLLLDVCTTYIDFARLYPKVFNALYFDNSGSGKMLYRRSLEEFKHIITSHKKMQNLTERQISRMHDGIWMAVTGIAQLRKAGIIEPTREQQAVIIDEVIESVLKDEKNK